MSKSTNNAAQIPSRLQINLEALTIRVIDLELRLASVERTTASHNRTLAMLVDSEVARLTADFTPEQVAEVRQAMRGAAERVAAGIRRTRAAGQ